MLVQRDNHVVKPASSGKKDIRTHCRINPSDTAGAVVERKGKTSPLFRKLLSARKRVSVQLDHSKISQASMPFILLDYSSFSIYLSFLLSEKFFFGTGNLTHFESLVLPLLMIDLPLLFLH